LEVALGVNIANVIKDHLPPVVSSSNFEMRRNISAMTKRLVLLLLISGTMCAAQSMLATPGADVQQNSEEIPMPNAANTQQQGNGQRGDYQRGGVPDLSRGTNELPQQPNTALPNQSNMRSARIVGPLRTKSEFQQYAEDATGRRLPVYGRLLFDQVPTTFAPVENVPVPGDYVLGPDDQLLIRAWGKIELNSRVTIDRNGQINLPRVGTVNVAGIHYSQVESYLRSAIGALFKDFDLNVTLGRLRTIQIYVLGNARQPGAYTVSSLSTLVDALFSSGGPSATGTMRDIQLRRDGKIITDFDLYDLVARGDKSKDVRLLPGDVIFIAPVGSQVAISGDINQPGIYEIKGDTTVGAALETAGGITSLASAERAVVERIDNHVNRSVQEFALDAQGQAHVLKDGDLVRVFPLSPKFQNAVTLRGNVAVPGLYPWKEGMRVSDLIPSRSALITRDYWNRQNHLVQPIAKRPFAGVRINPLTGRPEKTSDTLQQDQDENPRFDAYGNSIDAYGNHVDAYGNLVDAYGNPVDAYGNRADDYGNPRRARSDVQGQRMEGQDYQDQNAPTNQSNGSRGNQPRDDQRDDTQMTTSPLVASIGKNSAEINWEYAVIERLDERDLSTHLIPFRLASAIDTPSSNDNQLLKPGDVVTIFSRADLELPMEKHATFVRVGGEVNAPGIYRVNPGETLRDVVKRAGGLTQHSYLYASIFTRISTRVAQENELKQSTEQMQRELISKYANSPPQAGQTAVDQQAQLTMQQALLARLASIKPVGRVVLAMNPNAQTLADIPEFPLEDGDAYFIPPRLGTVQVAGAVYNANAFRYESGERLITYLNAAGGATRQADSKRMFVIRADGTVVSRQSHNAHSHGSYEKLKLLPGDAVVVPEKIRVSSKMNTFLQWTQLSSQLAITAAALNAIR
jgi:protein involved in polysaccharide export with SLBB domain